MTDRRKGEDACARANRGATMHGDMRNQLDVIAQHDIGADMAEGADSNIFAEFGALFHNSGWMNADFGDAFDGHVRRSSLPQ